MAYPGGKNGHGTLQRLLGLMPLHVNYFEPFLGGGAIAKAKTRAPGVTVGSDVDAGVIAMHGGEGLKPWGECRRHDALQLISSERAMADPDTLVYLDPPYLRSTRTRLFYRHEFATPQQHSRLLSRTVRLRCMVMISGYESSLYETRLEHRHGWRVVKFIGTTRGGPRVECVWLNFPEPKWYHDPVFAAVGFRARERVKRRSQRWAKRFAAMSPDERQVVWASLLPAMADPGTTSSCLASPAETRSLKCRT
jgi:hypothetical protein